MFSVKCPGQFRKDYRGLSTWKATHELAVLSVVTTDLWAHVPNPESL